MADIAELGFRVDSDPLKRAADRLDTLAPAAERAEKATDRFNHANDNARKSVDNLAAGTSGLTASLARLATGLVAAFSINQLITLTNTWTDLNSRVQIAAGSMEAGRDVMERLGDMARRTYSSLELTAESYLRNAVAMKQLGYNTNETLDYVEAINNALVVSGAKGERAASVLDALGKAMALGKLSGDQLETVLASGGRVAQALADSLGVTVLALRKLGTDGKLTGDVLQRGLTSQLEKLRAEADAMPATIGDAFVLLGNSILKAVGQFSELTGASNGVAQAIIYVADALGSGAISIEHFLAYATSAALFMGGGWVVSFIAANGAVGALVIGLDVLKGALIRTGFGILIVAAGELIYQIYKVIAGSRDLGDMFDRLKMSGIETWERITDGGAYMWHSLVGYAKFIEASFTLAWANILSGLNLLIQGIQDGYNKMAETFGQPTIDFGFASVVEGQMKLATDAYASGLAEMTAARTSFNSMMGDKSTRTNDLGDGGSFAELTSTLGAVTSGVHTMTTALTKAQEAAAKAYAKVVDGANDFIAAQQLEAQVLGMSAVQANTLRYAQDLLNKATEGGKSVTAAQRAELVGLAAQMAQTEQQTKNLTEAYNFGKQTLGSFFSDFKSDLMNGTSLWGAFANAAMNALGSIADKLMGMASDGLFDLLFNALGGAISGGGSLGNDIGKGISGAFSGGKLQFASGGYTGGGGTSQVAGVVHGGEYVLNAQATRSIGLGTLNAMNDNGSMPAAPTQSGSITFAPVYQLSGLGLSRDEVDEIVQNSNRQMLESLPDTIQGIQSDPRKRKRA